MIPAMRLCRAIAHTLKADPLFQNVAQLHYGRNWKSLVGFDGQKTDWEKQTPCVVVAPWKSEGEGVTRTYSISLTVAVLDAHVTDEDGVRLMHGLMVLDEQAWPAAWAALQDALPGLEPLAALMEPSLAISQEHFPLLMLHAGLGIEVNLPAGDRRL